MSDGEQTINVQKVIGQAGEWMAAGTKLLGLTVQKSGEFYQEASQLVRPLVKVPAWTWRSCCDIPEVDCPDRCVCQLDWRGTRGQTVRGQVRLTNTAQVTRHFTFEARSFSGADTPQIQLSQSKADLNPGESLVLQASLDIGTLQPGTHKAEILIRGAYEQCVCVVCEVQPEQVPTCEVRQGDVPLRVRAHHWYDHFQCSETCAPHERATHVQLQPAQAKDITGCC